LWTVVGAGYAIRGFTGLALAVDITKRPAIAVALVVALTAFGTAFVTITWTLEATVFGSWKYGRLIWPAQSAPGRQHILTLVRWLPDISDTLDTRDLRGHRVPQSGNNVTGWRALHDRRPLNAPYNLAILVAGAASTVLGRLLAGPADVASGLLAAMAGGAAALTVVVARYARILVMTAAVLGVGAVTQASNFPRPWLMNIPWVAIMGVYVIFTAQSWSTLKHPFADLLPVMRTFGMRLMRLFVGKASWDRLQQAAHETSR